MRTHTPSTLRTLLKSVVDYAGIFPPATLSLPDALRGYASAGAGPHAWMLGRCVLPAGTLEEVDRLAPAVWVESEAASSLSVLVAKEPTSVTGPLDRIRRFRETNDVVRVGAVEFAPLEPADLEAFFEVRLELSAADRDARLAAIAAVGRCAKVRTGGLTAEVFPRATDLAQFMVACHMVGVGFKATAGLHHAWSGRHPMTDDPGSAHAVMYGFLNVAVAAALLRSGQIDLAESADVLLESSAGAFTFANDRLGWRDRSVQGPDVMRSRTFFRSFGCCSFREPVAEFDALGWS